ncbi:MAG: hypothetical protein HRT76_02220 [Halieaceae bacterium]|nr:hypothetical protein [Halieaceae bacterium]
MTLCGVAVKAPAQELSQARTLQEARGTVGQQVQSSNIGSGYAQMQNFFVDPSISASRLEADDGVKYDVFKLPLQTEFDMAGGWELVVRGTLSHATAEDEFDILEGVETVDGSWKLTVARLGLEPWFPSTSNGVGFLAVKWASADLRAKLITTAHWARYLLRPSWTAFCSIGTPMRASQALRAD